MLKYVMWGVSVFFLFSNSLPAQYRLEEKHKQWEFSVFGGASFLGDNDFLTPISGQETPRTVGLEFEGGYVLGLSITENLGQHFGAELEYAYANQLGAFRNLRPTVPRLDLDHRVHKLAYSLLFYPLNRTERFRPYGSIGAGASLFQLVDDTEEAALMQGIDLRDRWKFAVSWGGGVKVHVDGSWGFRASFRDQVTGVPDFGLPSPAPGVDQAGLRPDGVLHNWQVTAGFIYWFNVR